MLAIDSALPDAVRGLLALLRRNLQAALQERGLSGSPPEVQIAQLIDAHPGISPMDIAAQTGFDKSVVARKLRLMEKSGLISRTIDAADNRRYRFATTAAGADHCQRLREVLLQTHNATFANLNPAEQRQLTALIRKCLGEARSD